MCDCDLTLASPLTWSEVRLAFQMLNPINLQNAKYLGHYLSMAQFFAFPYSKYKFKHQIIEKNYPESSKMYYIVLTSEYSKKAVSDQLGILLSI